MVHPVRSAYEPKLQSRAARLFRKFHEPCGCKPSLSKKRHKRAGGRTVPPFKGSVLMSHNFLGIALTGDGAKQGRPRLESTAVHFLCPLAPGRGLMRGSGFTPKQSYSKLVFHSLLAASLCGERFCTQTNRLKRCCLYGGRDFTPE